MGESNIVAAGCEKAFSVAGAHVSRVADNPLSLVRDEIKRARLESSEPNRNS